MAYKGRFYSMPAGLVKRGILQHTVSIVLHCTQAGLSVLRLRPLVHRVLLAGAIPGYDMADCRITTMQDIHVEPFEFNF